MIVYSHKLATVVPRAVACRSQRQRGLRARRTGGSGNLHWSRSTCGLTNGTTAPKAGLVSHAQGGFEASHIGWRRLLIVDDTFHLRSMRRQVYQLARDGT